MEVFLKPYLLYWLEDHRVEIIPEVKYDEITKRGLAVTTRDGAKRTIEADTVLTALPLRPNSAFNKAMEGKAKEVYVIGDSREPGLILDAIAEGAKVGRAV